MTASNVLFCLLRKANKLGSETFAEPGLRFFEEKGTSAGKASIKPDLYHEYTTQSAAKTND